MIEANPVKFYLAKYLLLGFAVVQLLAGSIWLVRFEITALNFFGALVLITSGLTLLFAYIMVSEKVRRVAVGKNKIVVIEGDRNIRFAWPEVKSLKLVPFFNLYRLKVKGQKNPIYFFPSKNIDPAFGLLAKDTSKMGDLVEKRKKEFGIE
jgi:hypothetical protein